MPRANAHDAAQHSIRLPRVCRRKTSAQLRCAALWRGHVSCVSPCWRSHAVGPPRTGCTSCCSPVPGDAINALSNCMTALQSEGSGPTWHAAAQSETSSGNFWMRRQSHLFQITPRSGPLENDLRHPGAQGAASDNPGAHSGKRSSCEEAGPAIRPWFTPLFRGASVHFWHSGSRFEGAWLGPSAEGNSAQARPRALRRHREVPASSPRTRML